MFSFRQKSIGIRGPYFIAKNSLGFTPYLLYSNCISSPNGPRAIFHRTLISRAAKSIAKEHESDKPTEKEDGTQIDAPSSELNEEISSATQLPRKEFEVPRKSMVEHPIVKRFPRSLRKYAGYFLDAPLVYGTSFLILHEITAIVPLFGLWGLFHQLDFVPQGMPEWLLENGNKFVERVANRYNWDVGTTQQGSRLMLEGAASYAVVKALLPLRAALSLYLTPWFARIILQPLLRITSIFKKSEKNENSKTRNMKNVGETDDLALDDELREELKRKKDSAQQQ
jgi:Hypothetical protein FLILHELTA